MFILASGGQTYCRLQFHVRPAAAVEPDVQVDYQQPFAASDHFGWMAEYEAKVHQLVAVAEVKELLGKDPPLWCPEKQNNAHSGCFFVDDQADDLVSESDADQAWEEYLQTYEEYAYGYY